MDGAETLRALRGIDGSLPILISRSYEEIGRIGHSPGSESDQGDGQQAQGHTQPLVARHALL
jgi:hypothetical protein